MTSRIVTLSLAAALAALPLAADAAVWNGTVDNAWLEAGNWTSSDGNVADLPPPDSNTETATFSSVVANNAPSFSAATTIGRLEFLSGAGSYTLGGSALTLSQPTTFTGNLLDNSSGTSQTISNNLTLTLTSSGVASNSGGRSINVGANSTLNLSGTVAANGGSSNIAFVGAGTLNVGGAFSSLNQVQQSGAGTLNINATQSTGSYFSFDSAGRINFNASTSRGAALGGTSSGSGRVFITTNNVTVSSMGLRGATTTDSTFGANIAGGGTATFTTVAVAGTGTRNAATYRASAASGNTLIINALTNSSGGSFDTATLTGSTRLLIEGGGVVRLAGTTANPITIPSIQVAAGRLELSKPAGVAAIGSTVGRVTVDAGGELRLLNANQIADGVAMTVAGLFNLNGLDEAAGALTLAGTPTIDVGADDSDLTFASLAGFGTSLTINNYTEGVDSILFTDITGWTQSRLDAVTFTGYGTGATLQGNELVPVPEPASLALLALGGLAMASRRKN